MLGLLFVEPVEAAAHRFGTFVARRDGHRPIAVALVAAVHLIAVWAIFANMRPSHILTPIPEFQLETMGIPTDFVYSPFGSHSGLIGYDRNVDEWWEHEVFKSLRSRSAPVVPTTSFEFALP